MGDIERWLVTEAGNVAAELAFRSEPEARQYVRDVGVGEVVHLSSADRGAVEALREAFVVLDGLAGDEHCTSPEIVRVAQVAAVALDRLGGQ